jgi:hypothetical protein
MLDLDVVARACEDIFLNFLNILKGFLNPLNLTSWTLTEIENCRIAEIQRDNNRHEWENEGQYGLDSRKFNSHGKRSERRGG